MTADPIGGVWRYVMELCQALRPYGAQLMLATLGAPLSPRQRAEVADLPHVDLRASEYRLEWMASPWDSLEEASHWLLSLEREFSPSLIHLNHLVHADLPWRAPVLVVGHSCVLSWWHAVHGGSPVGWSRYRDAVRQSLHAANLVIAPTQTMMESLQRHYGPLARCEVIANGLDPRRFHAVTKQNLILSAGRLWDVAKNVRALCEAAGSVAWPIFVAGPNRSPDGQLEPIWGVRSLGSLEPAELVDWYSTASLYALPAHYEPFGLTVLEAAFCGCALVLGDIPSLREVWDGAARYVPPGDSTALVNTLNELIADPHALHTLAALSRDRARHYTAGQLAANYWSTYSSLSNSSLLHAKDAAQCASCSSITR